MTNQCDKHADLRVTFVDSYQSWRPAVCPWCEIERLSTEQAMHVAWRKRAEHSEQESQRFRALLQRWLETSERFSFLANDTREALNGASAVEPSVPLERVESGPPELAYRTESGAPRGEAGDRAGPLVSPPEASILKAQAHSPRRVEPSEKLRCTCVWFTRDGSIVTQHWKDDPECPVHWKRIKAATIGLTITGLPEKSSERPLSNAEEDSLRERFDLSSKPPI